MSRTDKDRPDWVGITTWQPEHWRCERALRGARTRACDLPPVPPTNGAYTVTCWPRRCTWVPCTPRWWRYAFASPPRWYINHRWEAPQRMRARVQCRTAVAEYRATGVVEVVPTVDQHRHGARRDWS